MRIWVFLKRYKLDATKREKAFSTSSMRPGVIEIEF